MKNPNGPSIEEIDDWNDAKRDAEQHFASDGTPVIIKDLLFDATEDSSLVGVEVANQRIRASYQRFEARHVKEIMQHSVTRFELKQARALIQEFRNASNHLRAWIEHTVPTWTPEVEKGLERLRALCIQAQNAMPSCQPQPDKESK